MLLGKIMLYLDIENNLQNIKWISVWNDNVMLKDFKFLPHDPFPMILTG